MSFAAKELKEREKKEKEHKFIEELSQVTLGWLLSNDFFNEAISLAQFETILEKAIHKLPEEYELRFSLLQNITTHASSLYRSLKERKPVVASIYNKRKLSILQNDDDNDYHRSEDETLTQKRKKMKMISAESGENIQELYDILCTPSHTSSITTDDANSSISNYYQSILSTFFLNESTNQQKGEKNRSSSNSLSSLPSSSFQDHFLHSIRQLLYFSQTEKTVANPHHSASHYHQTHRHRDINQNFHLSKVEEKLWSAGKFHFDTSDRRSQISKGWIDVMESLCLNHTFELSSTSFSESVLEIIVKYLGSGDIVESKFYSLFLKFFLLSEFTLSKQSQISKQIFAIFFASFFNHFKVLENDEISNTSSFYDGGKSGIEMVELLSSFDFVPQTKLPTWKNELISNLYYRSLSWSHIPSTSSSLLYLIAFKRAQKYWEATSSFSSMDEIRSKITRHMTSSSSLQQSINTKIGQSFQSVDHLIEYIENEDESTISTALQSLYRDLQILSASTVNKSKKGGSARDISDDADSKDDSTDVDDQPLFFVDKKNIKPKSTSFLPSAIDDDDDNSDDDNHGGDDDDDSDEEFNYILSKRRDVSGDDDDDNDDVNDGDDDDDGDDD